MDEEQAQDDSLAKDVAPALLALHPHDKYVVVAVGTELRIFNIPEKCPVSIKDAAQPSCHGDAIKAIGFDREGKLFVSAGDDKLVKLWDVSSWRCIKTVCANKKVSATTFSHDGQWLLYADKFGVVSTRSNEDQTSAILDQPVQLLAHCCSIITCLECSSDGKYIVTGDRDFKIRVSIFPRYPLKGAHEIQGFCLGHQSFVSCIAFLGKPGATQLLVSGGGDFTVRLWDPETTKLLDTFYAEKVAGLMSEKIGGESERSLSITGITILNGGSLIAVAVESLDGILFLRCDFGLKQLLFLQKIIFAEHFCPTTLQFDESGYLWMVAGAAEKPEVQGKKGLLDASTQAVIWLKVVSTALPSSSEGKIEVKHLEGDAIPGGELLLKTMEGKQSQERHYH